MFCSQCGNPIDDQARFCAKCGQPVAQASVNQPVSQPSLAQPKQAKQPKPEKQPKQPRQPKQTSNTGKPFQSKLFWVLWLLLAIFCLLMLIGAFSPIALIVYVVLLGGLFLLRKKLFTGWLKSFGVLVLAVVIVFLPPVFSVDDSGLKRDVEKIEKAFSSNNVDQVAEFIHPESAQELLEVFAEHEQELARIGEMMKTRKLVYSDANYAEYEVTENGHTYIMIFEKVDGVWRLSRF